MPVKAVLESLDDAPESLREEYKPTKIKGKDGKETEVFVLEIDDVDSHPKVVNLKTAFERVKTEKKTLSDDIAKLKERLEKIPDDFDPEEFQRIKDELEALKGDDDDEDDEEKKKKRKDEVQRVSDMLKQRIKNLEDKHRSELEAKDQIIAKRDRTIEKLVVDDGLTKALVEAGVKPNFLKAAKAMLRDSVKVQVDGDAYSAIVDTDLGETELPKFITDWAASDEGKEFVEKPKGSDSKGSDSRRIEDNPWMSTDKVKPNLTKQGDVIKEAKKTGDFAKVERLMRAANRPQTEIDRVLGRSAA
jgi:hypothetical protein